MTDDDDSRIGAYAPPADEFETFDAREEENRRGTLLLTTAIAVLVLFVGVVWSAFNQGVRERDEAPRLLAEVEPYRERPADPGGEQTPDTNLDVYNRLTGDNDGDEDVSPRPAAEEPLEDTRPSLRIETVDADATEAAQPDTSQQIEETPLEEPTTDVTPRQAPDRPQRQPDPEPETREPEPQTRQSETRQPDPDPEPVIPAATPAGDWVVQIASFRSVVDAEAAWLAFQGRFSDISSGLGPDIASVEIAERGTYHRLRIAAFSTRDDAVSFCSTLQGRGQDCLVARR
ncbi:SPOR domain-containing protein [Maricaulis sp.]|uniref:SPOR domain-containing protein n=1 Tax=Maricaulis sp. TaxID=1486257 RepID=UPI001B240855|nr:SPOR domain-containing protein [Maricaulis sp.]MBO6797041.1 SPOR domain-containing protein [Maricaulis sp.]